MLWEKKPCLCFRPSGLSGRPGSYRARTEIGPPAGGRLSGGRAGPERPERASRSFFRPAGGRAAGRVDRKVGPPAGPSGRPEECRESIEIGPPAGRRSALRPSGGRTSGGLAGPERTEIASRSRPAGGRTSGGRAGPEHTEIPSSPPAGRRPSGRKSDRAGPEHTEIASRSAPPAGRTALRLSGRPGSNRASTEIGPPAG